VNLAGCRKEGSECFDKLSMNGKSSEYQSPLFVVRRRRKSFRSLLLVFRMSSGVRLLDFSELILDPGIVGPDLQYFLAPACISIALTVASGMSPYS
jgi:hypothetical protein